MLPSVQFGHEAIAPARHGGDKSGPSAAVSDRPPDLLDRHRDHRFGQMRIAPHLAQQAVLRDDLMPMADEVNEQIEWQGLEGLGMTLEEDLPLLDAHLAASEDEDLTAHGLAGLVWGCAIIEPILLRPECRHRFGAGVEARSSIR